MSLPALLLAAVAPLAAQGVPIEAPTAGVNAVSISSRPADALSDKTLDSVLAGAPPAGRSAPPTIGDANAAFALEIASGAVSAMKSAGGAAQRRPEWMRGYDIEYFKTLDEAPHVGSHIVVNLSQGKGYAYPLHTPPADDAERRVDWYRGWLGTSEAAFAPSQRLCKFKLGLIDASGADVPNCSTYFTTDSLLVFGFSAKRAACVLKPDTSYTLGLVLEAWKENPMTHLKLCGVALDISM